MAHILSRLMPPTLSPANGGASSASAFDVAAAMLKALPPAAAELRAAYTYAQRLRMLAAVVALSTVLLSLTRRAPPGAARLPLVAPVLAVNAVLPLLFENGGELISRIAVAFVITWLGSFKVLYIQLDTCDRVCMLNACAQQQVGACGLQRSPHCMIIAHAPLIIAHATPAPHPPRPSASSSTAAPSPCQTGGCRSSPCCTRSPCTRRNPNPPGRRGGSGTARGGRARCC